MAIAVWEPLCFDEPELEAWRVGQVAACADCTPSWHEQSRAAGRCNGIPAFLLAGVADDEEEEEQVDQVELQPRTRAVVTLSAPCGSCAHAAVCRLREAVERVRSFEVAAPSIDRAVTFELSATVSCSHYAKARGEAAPAAGKPKRQVSPEGLAAIRPASDAKWARRRAEQEAAGA